MSPSHILQYHFSWLEYPTCTTFYKFLQTTLLEWGIHSLKARGLIKAVLKGGHPLLNYSYISSQCSVCVCFSTYKRKYWFVNCEKPQIHVAARQLCKVVTFNQVCGVAISGTVQRHHIQCCVQELQSAVSVVWCLLCGATALDSPAQERGCCQPALSWVCQPCWFINFTILVKI